MSKPLIAAISALALISTSTAAHHKPGHNPPGQQKQRLSIDASKLPFSIRILEAEREIDRHAPRQRLGALPPLEGPFEEEWSFYQDPDFGFTIEVPTGIMEQLAEAPRGSRFREIDGLAVLDVYGGANSALLTPEEIADELERNPQIAEVTYRASGDSWVALSGYYTRANYEGDDLIFYAKFMFNQDGSHLSAFEISYRERDRMRFDPIVERLEDTLSAPL
ncbi:MAG TPA: hypothetical protein VIN06_13875 [Devosia sp.]